MKQDNAPHLDILVIADPIDTFKTYKDSTYAMMRAASRRGHKIWVCEQKHLFADPIVQADVTHIELTDAALPQDLQANNQGTSASVNDTYQNRLWYKTITQQQLKLSDFNAVLMRKDPPFDTEYFYATHLLSRAQTQGASVFNSGQALRDHPEKLAILEFPELAPTTLVSPDVLRIKAFIQTHQDVIVKPLDGMGGTGIFRVKAGDPNINVILETLTINNTQTIMAQVYLPAIVEGDKRVLLINGEPVPYCLARIPQQGETRGNLAAGGRPEARALTDSDWHIARTVAQQLKGRGLFLVGLDVIGNKLTEINVTSPTCFQEITQQTGFDVAKMYIEQLEQTCAG